MLSKQRTHSYYTAHVSSTFKLTLVKYRRKRVLGPQRRTILYVAEKELCVQFMKSGHTKSKSFLKQRGDNKEHVKHSKALMTWKTISTTIHGEVAKYADSSSLKID